MWASEVGVDEPALFVLEDGAAVGGVASGWLTRKSAGEPLLTVLASASKAVGSTSYQYATLAAVLLGQAPSADAKRIFETEVVGARSSSWPKRRQLVATLEALSSEEKGYVRIDAIIANSSLGEAHTWIRLAIECVAYDGNLPPLPQRVTAG